MAASLVCAASVLAQTSWESVPVLRAMSEEIGRTSGLRIVAPDPPYFVENVVYESRQVTGMASLGALVGMDDTTFRLPEIRVRVGSYDFDQGNYVQSQTSAQVGGFPLEDSLPVMRRMLWLSTDVAFKIGLESLARKRAALENVTVSENLPDFDKAEPVVLIDPSLNFQPNQKDWERRVLSLSQIFREFPSLQKSLVRFQNSGGYFYLANSEGSRVRTVEELQYVTASAESQAPDGMRVRNYVGFFTRGEKGFPADTEIAAAIRTMAKATVELAGAPLGEKYVGPMLFEGEASAQLFAQLLGDNLSLNRSPVPDPGRNFSTPDSELAGRKGLRVLPEFLDVRDDPSLVEWQGKPLIGRYKIDLEGVKPKPLQVVEKGVLKEFLLTRQPVKDYRQSNGRARLPGRFGAQQAAYSNLVVEARETVPREQLRQQFLALLKSQNKPWGIVIRRMDYPTTAPFAELRSLMSGRGPGDGLVSPPVEALKLYADGREELVRGLRFRALTARSLRDVVAAAEGSVVFNFLNSGLPLSAPGRFVAETSVVAPAAVLLEEVELDRVEGPLPNLPLAPMPAIEPR